MNHDLLVARLGRRIIGVTEAGTLSPKELRSFSEYEVAYVAREWMREADTIVFGEDYRWLHACTPKRCMLRRWRRYMEAIKRELP
jgi:hypothetical protein